MAAVNMACEWQPQEESLIAASSAFPADCEPNAAPTQDCVLPLSAIDVHAASPQHDTSADKAELSLAVDTMLATTCFPSTSLSACPTVDCSSLDSACATNDLVRYDSLSLATQPTDQFEVCLLRDSLDTSFGMQVAAYSGYGDAKLFNGIYVKAVVADSPAERTALINVNDRIVAVNSIDMTQLDNEDAMALLRQQMRHDLTCLIVLDRSRANAVLELLQKSNEHDETAVSSQESRRLEEHDGPGSSTCSVQLPELVTNANESTRSPSAAEVAESGNIHPDVEQAIQLTWADILGYDVDIVVTQFRVAHSGEQTESEQTLRKNNLGIALSWRSVDETDSCGSSKSACRYLVAELGSEASPCRGRLRCGDEILEINGQKIRDLPMQDVERLLHSVRDDVRIVAARDSGPGPDPGPDRSQSVTSTSGKSTQQLQLAADSGVIHYDLPLKCTKSAAGFLKSKSETNLTVRWTANQETAGCRSKQRVHNSTSPRTHRAAAQKRGRKRESERERERERKTLLHKPASSCPNARMLPLEVLMKTYSIQPLIGLAIWTREPVIIDLLKPSNAGLGFSVAEYRDPFNPAKTIIVVRSIVPAGVADTDGRLLPGDRLLFLNNTSVDSCTLDETLRVLRNLAPGVVRLGVAKPLPVTRQDALVDMTAPCDSNQDAAFQQYASLLANPVADQRAGKKRGTKRSDRGRSLRSVDKLDAEANDSTVQQELSSLLAPCAALLNASGQAEDKTSNGKAFNNDLVDEMIDNISESRISNTSLGLGPMTSMYSDSDVTLSDLARPTCLKLRKGNEKPKVPPRTVSDKSAKQNCQSACKGWTPSPSDQPLGWNSVSRDGPACEQCSLPSTQNAALVLVHASASSHSSATSLHAQNSSWLENADPDCNRNSVASLAPLDCKTKRASVSTTFTSTETDTADESTAFRVRRQQTPLRNRSDERLHFAITPTRKLTRAATCDDDHATHECERERERERERAGHDAQTDQRMHNSEATLSSSRPAQRNIRHLAPGTVVTTFLFRTQLGLGFSVGRRSPNVANTAAAHGTFSPNDCTSRSMNMYVKDIAVGSAAWLDGTLEPGDQITKINRVDVLNVDYKEALRLLRCAVGEIEITVLKQPHKMSDKTNQSSTLTQTQYSTPESSSGNSSSWQISSLPPWYVRGLPYDPKTAAIHSGHKTWIRLDKTDAFAHCGLGLSVAALAKRGARPENNQSAMTECIMITAIHSHSVSGADGRLHSGDRIWQVDDCDLNGIPADEAIRVLKEKSRTSKSIYLLVERRAGSSSVRDDASSTHSRITAEIFEVEIVKPPNGGIGILISGSGETGIIVTGVVPSSVAELDGRIQVGDILLELNGIDVTRFRQEEVATLLKNAHGTLKFKFKRSIEQISLRSYGGSVVSVSTASKSQKDSEVIHCVANSVQPSKDASPVPSTEKVQGTSQTSPNSNCMPKSPSSGSLGKHAQTKRRLQFLRKRARSVSPKRAKPLGKSSKGKNRSEDEGGESENTRLWQSILTPFNRIKYSIFPSFTSAKSSEEVPNSAAMNSTEEERFIENEYSTFDVFVMRDRLGQLGIGVTGGKLDVGSCTPEEISAFSDLNNVPPCLPVVITSIVHDGPVDRATQIDVGDRIVLINNQAVDGLTHEQIVQKLRGPPHTPIHFRLERVHERSRLLRLWPNKSKKSLTRRPGVWKITFERTISKGLGFCIMGGYDEIAHRFAPFVIKAVFPLSPAAKYGLKPGDQLLSVNGTPLEGELHETAVNLLKHSKDGKTTLLLLTS